MSQLPPTAPDLTAASSASASSRSVTFRAITTSRLLRTLGVAALGAVSFGVGWMQAQAAEPAKPAAAAPTNCKAFNGAKCCDPAVTAHLAKEAVFSACGESDATFLGESASKEACKYVFKVEGEKPDDTSVEVYAPAQKEVPDSPTDPFFSWKKVGKAYMTEKAKSPKAAPMMIAATGLWLPGKGYFVSVRASTKVCTKAEVKKLASSVK
jgi:hypothetical protein